MILDQQTLQTPGVLIGLISTGSGIGLLSGAFLTAPLSQHYTGGRIVQISVLVILLGCVFQPYTHQVYVLIICMTVTNLMIVPANSILGSYSDLIIPNALRGRVTSIFALCNIVLGSVSSAVAGILLAVMGYRNAMNTAVAAVLVTVLVTFTSRGIRDIPSRDQFSNLTPWE
ncbi:MFS transporter [Bifidobacterium hapali]|uniref:MFS transporter n=2 Tax=Bifidobacterium hapali TaxID=1630172 RepID=A0A261G3Z3_9BIFI|nr:MFS transporter [Bifidobacterium hapali]OZG66128.1 MFS transporter [Bifidobacterium hapali]